MRKAIVLLLIFCLLLPVLALADAEDQAVWELPNKAQEYTKGLRNTVTTKVSQITGEDSDALQCLGHGPWLHDGDERQSLYVLRRYVLF